MAKYIDEKIGAMSQKDWHGLKYKNPLKNYRVHEMPTGDQLPPHYLCLLRLHCASGACSHLITLPGLVSGEATN